MQNKVPNFNFIKARKIWLMVYAVIIVAAIIVYAIFGANLSIDFKGGTVLNYSFIGTVDLEKAENAIESTVGQKVSVTENTNYATGSKSLVITLPDISTTISDETKATVLKTLNTSLAANKITAAKVDPNADDSTLVYNFIGSIKSVDTAKADLEKALGLTGITIEHDATAGSLTVTLPSKIQSTVTSKLTQTFAENKITNTGSNTVSASIASNFFLKCLVAVLLASILVVIYVGIRFRKIGGVSAGMFALLALFLDCIMAFATCVFFRLEIDSNFMSVILTTLGYSLNDTIVIYDRLRENTTMYPTMDMYERVNSSINQSLGRTIKTTLATFLAIIAVVIVAEFFGLSSLRSFAIPMAVGIVSGSISSICLSCPLWYSWRKAFIARKENKMATKA